MKTLVLLVLLGTTQTGCQKSEIGTQAVSLKVGQLGEVAAVITKLDLSSLADCACCASYQFKVGNDTYQADQLPVSFDTLTATVWVQYDRQSLSGVCSQVQNRIRVISIRNRYL